MSARGRDGHRLRQHHLSARPRCSTPAGSSGSASTSRSTATPARGARSATTTASSSACARARTGATTSQPSVGDFLEVYEPLLEEGREIVSIHLSRQISGTFEAASQARQRLVDEGRGRRAGPRDRQPHRLRRHGDARARAPRRWPKGGAGGERDRRARERDPRAAAHVVRDRHARVPAPGRPDRRGAGLARLGASDQADPHAGGGDHPGRARPHAPARLRAPRPVRAGAARTRAATPGSSSTSTTPRTRSAWSSAAAR